MAMSRKRVTLDEFKLGVDLCPHTLDELIDDLKSTRDHYDKDPYIVIEDGNVELFKYVTPKPNCVVFDSDEVLLNWPLGFVNWHNKTYGSRVDTSNGVDYDKDIKTLFDQDPDVTEERMLEFNTSSWEFGCLEPMKHAVTGIEYIKDYNRMNPDNQIKIIVVTKCGDSTPTRNMRIANLVNVFGDVFEEIITLNLCHSKVSSLQYCAEHYNTLMFVDDYFSNITQVRDATCIPCFALRAPHNKHMSYPGSTFGCDTWSDLFAEIVSVLRNA